MSDTPLVDWKNDESVVRAAVPDAEIRGYRHGKVAVYSALHEGQVGVICCTGTREARRLDAWHCARQNDIVRAFEAAHNPAQLPALPEETGFEEEWNSGATGRVFASMRTGEDPPEFYKAVAHVAYNAALSRRAQPQDASETKCGHMFGDVQCGYARMDCMHEGSPSTRIPALGRHKFVPSTERIVAQRKAGAQ